MKRGNRQPNPAPLPPQSKTRYTLTGLEAPLRGFAERVKKQEDRLDDGRRIIYYSFEDEEGSGKADGAKSDVAATDAEKKEDSE